MSQRTALLAATALTVFVVTMVVGVVWQLFQKSTVDTFALQVAVPPQTTEMAGETRAVGGSTQAEIDNREAAFQQLIQQANQNLEQAYKQQEYLTSELAAQKKQAASLPAPAVVPEPPKYNVSAEQPTSIALDAEKGAVLVKPAELISFQGTVAYEVTLDRGLVYIDANTGQIIYDSALVIVIHDSRGGGGNAGGSNPVVSAPKNTGGHENEHEHENEQSHGAEDHHESGQKEGSRNGHN
ncbi:MAG TPA: PepSY domain-containing protein [Anaerolineae bacterium]